MPLDRAHITAASRIMLPVYVVFFGVIGINFLASPQRLAASPMLRYADHIMPLRVWGAMFFTCCILMLIALAFASRDLYRFALLMCAVSMLLWTLVAILGAFVEPVSFSAWAWPGTIAAACLASNRSLVRREGFPVDTSDEV